VYIYIIQCQKSKLNNFRHHILSLNRKTIPITVVELQEIWQASNHTNLSIPGFKFGLVSRKNAKGGGIGFYIKK
jgi:hypothetical protein